MKLSEMTIKRYYEYLEVLDSENNLDVKVKKAAFITKKPYLEVRNNMVWTEIEKNSNKFDLITDDLKKEIPSGNIKIGDRVFKCVYEPEKMIAGQFIDFMETTKKYAGNPHNFHAVLAVMCYEGKEYDGVKNSEKEELFLNELNMGVAYPYAFFLHARLKVLNNYILPYLEREFKSRMTREILKKRVLQRDGAGLYYWRGFVRFTARTWMRLRTLVSLSFLIGGLILKRAMIWIGNAFVSKKDK